MINDILLIYFLLLRLNSRIPWKLGPLLPVETWPISSQLTPTYLATRLFIHISKARVTKLMDSHAVVDPADAEGVPGDRAPFCARSVRSVGPVH